MKNLIYLKENFPFKFKHFIPMIFLIFIFIIFFPPLTGIIYGILGGIFILIIKIAFEKLIIIYQSRID